MGEHGVAIMAVTRRRRRTYTKDGGSYFIVDVHTAQRCGMIVGAVAISSQTSRMGNRGPSLERLLRDNPNTTSKCYRAGMSRF